MSRFQDFKISRFQDFKISRIQDFCNLISKEGRIASANVRRTLAYEKGVRDKELIR